MDQTILRRAAKNLGEARRLIAATKEGLRTDGAECQCCTSFRFANVHHARLARSVEAMERKVDALFREFEKAHEADVEQLAGSDLPF
jgi:hypothetical protein